MITAAGATSLTAVLSPPLAAAGTFLDDDGFLALSRFLTGRPALDRGIAVRAFRLLRDGDAQFATQAAALWKAISDEKLGDMAAFTEFGNRHHDLRPTALRIVSAWYLGYTGTPSMNATPAIGHPVDDAHFVSYAGALMYEPTRDTTVIPSYSRGRTNYWAQPPRQMAG